MHLDRDLAFQTEKSHRCSICKDGASLVTRWDGKANSYDLRCGKCGGESFEKRPTMMQRLAAGESLPIEIINKLQAKYGGLPMSTQALTVIDEPRMLQRIERARWSKDLTPVQRQTLAEISVAVGLDPLLKELIIYEGEPYITLPGYEGLARRSAEFEGLRAVPMSNEQKEQYGIKAPYAWVAEVYKRGMRVPSIGVGTADPANPFRGNPMEKREPWRMARSRAIRQAIRPYFGTEQSPVKLKDAEEAGIYVDQKTGEVIDIKKRPDIRIVQPEASSAVEGEVVDEVDTSNMNYSADDKPEEPQREGDYPAPEVPRDAEGLPVFDERETLLAEIRDILSVDDKVGKTVQAKVEKKKKLADLTVAELHAIKPWLIEQMECSGVKVRNEPPADTTMTGGPLPENF